MVVAGAKNRGLWSLCIWLFVTSLLPAFAQVPVEFDRLPSALKPLDPDVRDILRRAFELRDNGKLSEGISEANKALKLASSKNIVNDEAICRASLARSQSINGDWSTSKSELQSALREAVQAKNPGLRAVILLALSSAAQVDGKLNDSSDFLSQALNQADESKLPFVRSQVLAQLGYLAIQQNNLPKAQGFLEEAVQIDKANNYSSLPVPMIYLAQVKRSQNPPDLDAAKSLLSQAEQFAALQENYFALLMSAIERGKMEIVAGNLRTGIAILEGVRNGVYWNTEYVKRPAVLKSVAETPLFHTIAVATLGDTYKSQKNYDKAVEIWTDLANYAAERHLNLFEAGSNEELANSYRALGKTDKAIEFYQRSIDQWTRLDVRVQAIRTLSEYCDFLLKAQKFVEAEPNLVRMTDLARKNNLKYPEFTALKALAPTAATLKKDQEAREAYLSAQRLIDDLQRDSTLNQQILAKEISQFYVAYYLVHANDYTGLVSLINAGVFAERAKDEDSKNKLDAELSRINQSIDAATKAEENVQKKQFSNALILYEAIYREYANKKQKEPALAPDDKQKKAIDQIISVPFEMIKTEEGARSLEGHLSFVQNAGGFVRKIGWYALMIYYRDHGQFDKAMRFGGLADSLIDSNDTKSMNEADARILCEYTLTAYRANQGMLANQLNDNCLRNAKLFPDDKVLQEIMRRLQLFRFQNGNTAESISEVRELVKNHPNDPVILGNLGEVLARSGEISESEVILRQALSLAQQQHNEGSEASIKIDLADVIQAAHKDQDGDEQLSLLRSAAEALERQHDFDREFTTRTSLIMRYASHKKKLEFDDELIRAQKLIPTVTRKSALAELTDAKAQGLFYLELYPPSLEERLAAVKLYRDLNDKSGQSRSLLQAGYVYQKLSRNTDAIAAFEEAQRLADESKTEWITRYWSRRALVAEAERTGQLQRGITLLIEAKQISQEVGSLQNVAWAANSLAWLYATVGEWEAAVKESEQSLKLARETHDIEHEFATLSTLINLFGDRRSTIKDLPKAIRYYNEASQLANAHKEFLDVDNLADDLVEVYKQQGEFEKATILEEKALRYYEHLKSDTGIVNSLITAAELQGDKHDFSKAMKSLEAAEELVKKLDDLYVLGRFYYVKAGILRKENKCSEAIPLYRLVIDAINTLKSGVETSELKRVAENYGFVFDELISCLYSEADARRNDYTLASQAFAYSELDKAREFSSIWGQTFLPALRATLPAGLIQREQTLDDELDDLQTKARIAGPNSRPALEQQIAKDNESRLKLISEITAVAPAYAQVRFPKPIDAHGLPLRPGEMLLEYRVGEQETFVFELTNNDSGSTISKFLKLPHGKKWLEERVFEIRDAYNSRHPEKVSLQTIEELYAALLAPLAVDMKSMKSLIIVPDDVLFLLPFEILSPRASKSEFPMASIPTRYFASAASFNISRAAAVHSQWSATFFGIGNPITNESPHAENDQINRDGIEVLSRANFEPLPGTEREIRSLGHLFNKRPGVELELGQDATKARLFETDLSKFRFLHFATHGLLPVGSIPREPALLFTPGKSNMNEALMLSTEVFKLNIRADMVTLSACNTGSGKVTRAEGVANLGRSFLMAGANSVVVSLWQVSDDSTVAFMQRFYSELLDGKDKATALADARVYMLTHGYTNPFNWGPFTLMGE